MRFFAVALSTILAMYAPAAIACSSPSHHHAAKAACQGDGCAAVGG